MNKLVIAVLVMVGLSSCGGVDVIASESADSTAVADTDEAGKDESFVPDLSDVDGGMMTQEEGELLYLEYQHDIELSLDATPVVDGEVVLTVSIRALDTNFANEIRAELDFSEGVAAVEPPVGEDYWSDDCLINEGGFLSCWVGDSVVSSNIMPTAPVTMDLTLSVDPAAVDPTVTVSASHSGYPLENDPDPTNNVARLSLVESGPSPLVGEDLLLDWGRVDLDMTAWATEGKDGKVGVAVDVVGGDRVLVEGLVARYEFGDGVRPVDVWQLCTVEKFVVECPMTPNWGPDYDQPEPLSYGGGVWFEVDAGADDAMVSVSVMSLFNPLSNDLDPSNNVATVSLAL